MSRLRLNTLRGRLVVLITVITAAAIAFVYLYVVPQLESSLTAEKLRRLERLGTEQSPQLARALESGASQQQVEELVDSTAQATESRVTLLAVRDAPGGPLPAFVIADSQAEATAIQGRYLSAGAAVADGHLASGVEHVAGTRVATSAVPLQVDGRPRWVEVLSTPLADVNDDVALVRRQILIAGLIALVAASLIGFWASGAVSRRLRRMRRAAESVAEGHFDQPIPVESSDELGQLARTFNEMQRRLARLDSSRKEFIANASHELRTPIFSLGGFVELLETERPSAAERRAFVAEMRAQIERLQKLTIDLLDLSRLDADVMEIKREQVDLKDVARQVADEFRPAAKAHDSTLLVRGRGSVVALADLNRVSQIIRILIDNALTHTPQGTNVTVTAVRAGGTAELIIGDDAKKGIDPRAIPKVFDRFYTGDTATGSGLGLAIADELATRMGGKITVASRRGHTAFTLRLPPAGRRRRHREPAGVAA
ncbi:MAG TPA: HAMP domain-containing sensor histidine kinase [Solirubrobacterales bacterium]|nr:HAMP domain-containing sensor histidine kinase [Solirubrobacterales bacterium]